MKMDPKLVGRMQNHEVSFVARKFRIAKSDLAGILERVGRSRRKVYEAIRALVARRKKAYRARCG